MLTPAIRNLLFDLGGVILNIDFLRVAESFTALTPRDFNDVRREIEARRIFQQYETGAWTDAEFRHNVREILQTGASDRQIDDAWNAMLLDFPKERITLLQQLRKHYRVFLLSNTNPIHLRRIDEILLRDTGIARLDELFDKAYYSCYLDDAKPAASIYQKVMKDGGMQLSDTLFIDDNADNIAGAKQLEMLTVHIQAPTTILEVFADAQP